MWNIFHKIYVANISVFLISIPVLVLVWSVIGAAFYKWMRIIGAVLAVVAVGAIIYTTMIFRGESETGLYLVPFSSFERAETHSEMYRSMLMNVFLFVPLGFTVPYVIGGGTVKKILLTILIGFLLSATAEAVQYFAAIGMTETDDVICNTLGTAIVSCAYPISLLWRKLFNLFKDWLTHDDGAR